MMTWMWNYGWVQKREGHGAGAGGSGRNFLRKGCYIGRTGLGVSIAQSMPHFSPLMSLLMVIPMDKSWSWSKWGHLCSIFTTTSTRAFGRWTLALTSSFSPPRALRPRDTWCKPTRFCRKSRESVSHRVTESEFQAGFWILRESHMSFIVQHSPNLHTNLPILQSTESNSIQHISKCIIIMTKRRVVMMIMIDRVHTLYLSFFLHGQFLKKKILHAKARKSYQNWFRDKTA